MKSKACKRALAREAQDEASRIYVWGSEFESSFTPWEGEASVRMLGANSAVEKHDNDRSDNEKIHSHRNGPDDDQSGQGAH